MRPLLPQHAWHPAKQSDLTHTPGPTSIAQLGKSSATLTTNHAAMDVGTVAKASRSIKRGGTELAARGGVPSRWRLTRGCTIAASMYDRGGP